MTRHVGAAAAVAGVAACAGRAEDGDAGEGERVVVGTAAPASGGLPSVVLLEPQTAAADLVPPDTLLMDQYASTFIPQLLVVRVGQAVEFRNSEEVAHMVRVRDVERASTLFNVATPMGDPHTHVFDRRGSYAVSCDIHPSMTGFILAVTAPHHGIAEDDGSFTVQDVPPGTYTMTVWSRDSTLRAVRTVEVGEGRTEVGNF